MDRHDVAGRTTLRLAARASNAPQAPGNCGNTTRLVVAAIVVGLMASCANVERSRDLANPNVSGQTMAMQVCSNCHGATGNSVSPNFPNLAAQQEAYLAAQLHEFKGHSREDPAGFEYMWGLSHNLTDKQIQELAAHFAGQELERHAIEGRPDRIAAGKAIFTVGLPDQSVPACSSCHGPEGMGNGTFPRIAGQHADYLVKQLKVFQRTNQRPQAVVMKTVAHELTKQNIENVAAYLQAMPNQ
jgi:cytochrome c553